MADERYGNVACRRALRVMMTFEFDAESLWLARDPANAKRPRYCRALRQYLGRLAFAGSRASHSDSASNSNVIMTRSARLQATLPYRSSAILVTAAQGGGLL